MSQIIPIIDCQADCETVASHLNPLLSRQGYQVVRSFDLQVARAAHAQCCCPHHGTEDCTCQMMVLLVYTEENAPVTVLVLHGYDGLTHVGQVVDSDERSANNVLENLIKQAVTHVSV